MVAPFALNPAIKFGAITVFLKNLKRKKMSIWKRLNPQNEKTKLEEAYVELEDYYYNQISTCPQDYSKQLEPLVEEYGYYLAVGELAKELAIKRMGS